MTSSLTRVTEIQISNTMASVTFEKNPNEHFDIFEQRDQDQIFEFTESNGIDLMS